MTRHLLVPVDGSSQSEAALEHALTVFPAAEITALSVLDPSEFITGMEAPAEGSIELQQEHVENILNNATEIADEHGREITTESRTGKPTREIIDCIENQAVDQVVMGSQGRTGLSRLLLGSVAENVTRRSPVPVTVVR